MVTYLKTDINAGIGNLLVATGIQNTFAGDYHNSKGNQ